jgi:hypothetical protein
VPLIVDTDTPVTWATRAQARNPRLWPDAPTDDETLDLLLQASTDQCRAFAPVLATGAVLPDRYTLATIYQARELQAAAHRDGDVIGVGDYAIRSRPLTSTVKQLLRPQSGRPGIG